MKQNSILDKGISLWWDSLSEYEKQRKLLRNGFESILVTGEWKVKCYHAEHPTKPLLESHTDNLNKEGGETKGEWVVERHEKDSRYFGNITSKLGIGERGFMNIRTIAVLLKYASNEEMQANAELIASAPKLKADNLTLLSDVKLLRSNLKDLHHACMMDSDIPTVWWQKHKETVAQAKLALDKTKQ